MQWASLKFQCLSRVYCFILLLPVLGAPSLTLAENSVPGVGDSQSARPFTVADSISMKRVVDLERLLGLRGAINEDYSPDGEHFYIVTRKGDAAAGLNHYEMLLYSVSEVLEYINASEANTPPAGRVLVRLSTTSDHGVMRQHAIRQVSWSQDGDRLFYIGDSGENAGQVYSVDIETAVSQKLTDHPRTVLYYQAEPSEKTLLYLSTVENLDPERNAVSYVTGLRSKFALTNMHRESPFYFKYQYYVATTRNNTPARAVGDAYIGRIYTREARVWMSPGGDRALVLIPYKEELDSLLARYKPIANSKYYTDIVGEYFDDNTAVPNRGHFLRFELIDLNTGASRAFLGEAPAVGSIGWGSFAADWSPDGQSVVFGPTFLPTDGVKGQELSRRRKSPAIVNYNVKTGITERVTDLLMSDGEEAPLFHRTELVLKGLTHQADGLLSARYRQSADNSTLTENYRKQDENWIKFDASDEKQKSAHAQPPLKLTIREGLNTPPDVFATDLQTGVSRKITDLNPQFKQRTFGRTEVFYWRDEEGNQWEGGLTFPPDYERGKRYPLTIFQHGFDKNAFLIDGRAPAGPYAAQALANKGIVVLHMPTIRDIFPSGFTGEAREINMSRMGVEAAIETLATQGVIDKSRVGVLGFSRSGLYTDNLITFSEYDFAAAVITDASTLSLSNITMGFGLDGFGMRFIERIIGDVNPWGEGLSIWACRITTFNLDRVKTPIRFENYLDHLNFRGYYWDQYTLLRRLQKPVEMINYPRASHATISPSARLASAGGAVDWFAFWLNGEEDADPAKAEQYVRWRKLRAQQPASEAAAIKARERINAPKECELRFVE